LRSKLKKPLGTLIRESNVDDLLKIIGDEKPKKLISVGDATSRRLLKIRVTPDIIVIDNKIARTEIRPIDIPAERVYKVKNPAGTLTDEAWRTMAEVMESDKVTKIIVDGEEDLITLLAVHEAPVNSIVLYGQPGKGVVVVKVTEDKKEEIRKIINEMDRR